MLRAKFKNGSPHMQPNQAPSDTAAYNLRRQIDLERRLLEQLRGVREYQGELLRSYSKDHGFLVPLTVDQFLEHSRRAA